MSKYLEIKVPPVFARSCPPLFWLDKTSPSVQRVSFLIRRARMFQLLLLYCCFTAFSQSGTLAQGSMSGMAMQMMEMMLHPLEKEYSLSYSPHELEVAKAAYLNATANPCSAKGRATKECCSMCNYCDKCEACKVCDLMCTDICKYCPQCPQDCVQSGYCGQVCNVTGLPETRPCFGCGCKWEATF